MTRVINHAIFYMVFRMMNLQPPTPFSFANSEEWPKWKWHFEHAVSSSIRASRKCQVNTLLYCLGEDAKKLLISQPMIEVFAARTRTYS